MTRSHTGKVALVTGGSRGIGAAIVRRLSQEGATVAFERAPAGSVFNGVHGAATPLIEIARAASEAAGAGGRVEAWALEDARSVLWAFADAIACDQVVSGEKAERELGWRPSHRSIIDELRSYRSKTD